MLVSHSSKFIFIRTPKTASQSISELLMKYYGGVCNQQYHDTTIKKPYTSYFIFTSVRNPYSRTVSLYRFIRAKPFHRVHQVAMKKSFYEFCQWLSDLTIEPALNYKENEEKTAECSAKMKGRDENQFDFLSKVYSRLNAILHMERLKEEMIEKIPFFNKNHELPFLNCDPGYDFRRYINEKTEPLIYQWSEADFLNLGYKRYEGLS